MYKNKNYSSYTIYFLNLCDHHNKNTILRHSFSYLLYSNQDHSHHNSSQYIYIKHDLFSVELRSNIYNVFKQLLARMFAIKMESKTYSLDIKIVLTRSQNFYLKPKLVTKK